MNDKAATLSLTYTKISKEVIKLFYEPDEGGYGEIYLRLNPDGTAEFQLKDKEYTPAFAFGILKMLMIQDGYDKEKHESE